MKDEPIIRCVSRTSRKGKYSLKDDKEKEKISIDHKQDRSTGDFVEPDSSNFHGEGLDVVDIE